MVMLVVLTEVITGYPEGLKIFSQVLFLKMMPYLNFFRLQIHFFNPT